MKLYFVCSRNYLLIFYILLLFLTVFGLFVSTAFPTDTTTVYNEEERQNFLTSLGIKDFVLAQVRDITIPWNFSEEYKDYNNIQISSGYNLYKFSGENMKMYVYSFDGFLVHIIVNNYGEVVGGDVTDPLNYGCVRPLTRESINEINST